jgi:hypothetical protein
MNAIMAVIDDHSVASRGVEYVLAVIDFQFGARVSPGPLWHTAGDKLDAVSAASLNSVGGVLVETVRAIEEHWSGADRLVHRPTSRPTLRTAPRASRAGKEPKHA